MKTFNSKTYSVIDELIMDIERIAFDGNVKTKKMNGKYNANQIIVVIFGYGYNETECVHFLPSEDGNISEVRILDVSSNSNKLSYWIGSFLKKRGIESIMKDGIYTGTQNETEQSYTTYTILNMSPLGDRYQRLRNRIINIARIKNCPIQSFGIEKICNSIVQNAFPNGVYSELICLNSPNQLRHGDLYLILDQNKELISIKLDSPESSLIREIAESKRVYGETYNSTLQVPLEGEFFIF